ncbi:ankyrin repeat domain-containing protein [Algibacter miyuki]|uniref:Ankyrin repeat domain-containing protein n=1 Tax=Algibacter miyuki TaxID=1306933 RepID=A0ABV5GZL9_9FLAO|nr:ankyrin repeat domain-containing protein [Algibacter miyuki]MDN3666721.1 ankyrin repeat domain-containing protein [Algibacter miyuki]
MKKSIIISAIALSFTFGTAHATPFTSTDNAPEIVRYYKVNSFCVSIALGDIDTVMKLLSIGEDVNQVSNGMTPAMYAAKYNRTEILELLIKHGANLKAKTAKKMTAAKYAEIHGADEAAQIIKTALVENKKK